MRVKGYFSRVIILLVSIGWIFGFLRVVNSYIAGAPHPWIISLLLIINIIFYLFKKDISKKIYITQLIAGLLAVEYTLAAQYFRPVSNVIGASDNMFLIYSLIIGVVFITNYFIYFFTTKDIRFSKIKVIEIFFLNLGCMMALNISHGYLMNILVVRKLAVLLLMFLLTILVYGLVISTYILWLKKGLSTGNKKVSIICLLSYLIYIFGSIYIVF